jgi:anthranilate synthase component I
VKAAALPERGVDVRTPLVSTADIPPGIALHRLAAAQPERYPVLLDSAAEGARERFSVLCAAPRAALWRDAGGVIGGFGIEPRAGGFFDNLEAWVRSTPKPVPPTGPLAHIPFRGGWIIYVGYEAAAEIERHLVLPPAQVPLAAFALRIEHFVVHDLATDHTLVVSEVPDLAAHRAIVQDLWNVLAHPRPNESPAPIESLQEEPPELFLERVRRAQEHIAAGDVYQANLSRPWRARLRAGSTAGDVYAALRRANPAPFAASVQFGGMTILSSSPERLLEVRGRDISTRPIAGTRPRHGSLEQDRRETAELVAHPKERAEHVMLIDLERSDLGRVCEAGSVEVDEYMVTESYAHVHHIVSNVRGRLRADRDAIDALRALFPGGTITGCPKVRCMQIIAALEGEGRGAYTGSLGWLGTDGDADFNILIRTLSIQGRDVEFRAGAGIVADSIPERELEETRAKARGLLRAFAATS